MKFFIVDRFGDSLGVAWRLQYEGHEVKLFLEDKQAQGQFKGILEQITIEEGEKWNPDYIIFGMVGFGKEADRLSKKFPVFGASSIMDRLEYDRKFALQTLKKAGIKIPKHEEFKNAAEADKFLTANPGKWVLKPFGNKGNDLTYVGEDAKDLAEFIHREEKNLSDGFLLQEFVKGLEISTEVFYSEGIPILPSNNTFETKKFMNDDLGPTVGCSSSVVWKSFNNLPYNKTLKKLEPFMKETKYTGPLDINCIISDKDKQMYALELTGRLGYSAIYALMKLVPELGEFIADVCDGISEAPYKEGYAAALRVTIPPYPLDDKNPDNKDKLLVPLYNQRAKGVPIEVEFGEDIIPLDVCEENKKFVCSGFDGIVAKAPPKEKMKKGIKEGIKSNVKTKKGLAPTDLTSASPYRNSTPFGHSASQNSHNATKGLAERVPTHSSPLKRRGGRRTEI